LEHRSEGIIFAVICTSGFIFSLSLDRKPLDCRMRGRCCRHHSFPHANASADPDPGAVAHSNTHAYSNTNADSNSFTLAIAECVANSHAGSANMVATHKLVARAACPGAAASSGLSFPAHDFQSQRRRNRKSSGQCRSLCNALKSHF
jgi:hypothetical protein